MSGSGHNDSDSKFSAFPQRWADIRRRDAARQRRLAVEQRERLRSAWRDLTRFTAPPETAVGLREHVDRTGDAALAIVALAASAGGLTPLATILGRLPRAFRAAIIVAQHTGPRSTLPTLLKACCPLPVTFAADGEFVRPAHVYVCPPGQHVVVNADRTFTVRRSELFEPPYPSADWLFYSVSAVFGENAIAVVLSGTRDDGARGIVEVRRAGGAVIVQEPGTCAFAGMPDAALRTNCGSIVLGPGQIGDAVVRIVAAMDFSMLREQFDDPFQSAS